MVCFFGSTITWSLLGMLVWLKYDLALTWRAFIATYIHIRHATYAGCRQLFLGDVQSGVKKFEPLFQFLARNIVLADDRRPLDRLPSQARTTLLSVTAAYLLYYQAKHVQPEVCLLNKALAIGITALLVMFADNFCALSTSWVAEHDDMGIVLLTEQQP